jgi:hypothetical protein
MTDLNTFRIRTCLADEKKPEEFRQLLLDNGIDPRTCSGKKVGNEYVYEGFPPPKGDGK